VKLGTTMPLNRLFKIVSPDFLKIVTFSANVSEIENYLENFERGIFIDISEKLAIFSY
jgi:hypothetical protein